ncbi:hypothetical protein JXM83_02885 [Candidatus Woesearchaeota archaeon]|nr:hypothetical protein [Candidatus Woesearchaeota archaeon]
MGLGSLVNMFKKSKGKDSPKVPPLDSKSNNIPKPKDPFEDSSSNNFGSDDDGFGDLPDFPDFPGSSQQESGMQNGGVGITPPKPIDGGMQQTARQQDFSAPAAPKKQTPAPMDLDSQLNYYETNDNSKYAGSPKVITEGEEHFVSIHDYKQVLEFLDSLKDNTDNFENSMMEIGDINNNCANLEDSFKKTVEDIQRKLIFVDKTLFEIQVK